MSMIEIRICLSKSDVRQPNRGKAPRVSETSEVERKTGRSDKKAGSRQRAEPFGSCSTRLGSSIWQSIARIALPVARERKSLARSHGRAATAVRHCPAAVTWTGMGECLLSPMIADARKWPLSIINHLGVVQPSLSARRTECDNSALVPRMIQSGTIGCFFLPISGECGPSLSCRSPGLSQPVFLFRESPLRSRFVPDRSFILPMATAACAIIPKWKCLCGLLGRVGGFVTAPRPTELNQKAPISASLRWPGRSWRRPSCVNASRTWPA
jgi:hypothetical protein